MFTFIPKIWLYLIQGSWFVVIFKIKRKSLALGTLQKYCMSVWKCNIIYEIKYSRVLLKMGFR